MALKRGNDGTIKFGATPTTPAGKINDWTLNLSGSTIETSGMGDDWAEFLAGNKSWTGSCNITIDFTDGTGTVIDGTQSTVAIGTEAAVEFYVDAVTGKSYSGTCIITDYAVTSSYGDKVTAAVSFQGTGALVPATV